jgi:hypothetical protein
MGVGQAGGRYLRTIGAARSSGCRWKIWLELDTPLDTLCGCPGRKNLTTSGGWFGLHSVPLTPPDTKKRLQILDLQAFFFVQRGNTRPRRTGVVQA